MIDDGSTGGYGVALPGGNDTDYSVHSTTKETEVASLLAIARLCGPLIHTGYIVIKAGFTRP